MGDYTRAFHKLGIPRSMARRMLQLWRSRVKQRDYKCQIGPIGCEGIDTIHHILYLSNYPGLMFNINNGIVLCNKHHREIHDPFAGDNMMHFHGGIQISKQQFRPSSDDFDILPLYMRKNNTP